MPSEPERDTPADDAESLARAATLESSIRSLVRRAAASLLWRLGRRTPTLAGAPAAPAIPPPLVQLPRLLTPRAFRVLFVTPDRGFVSHRPRVAYYAAYLETAGVETHIVDLGELEAALPRVPLWDVVVAFRLQSSPLVRRLWEACRRAGVVVVFDVDDLVFDPAPMAAGQVDALRWLPPAALADALAQPGRFLEALRGADVCTVTTTALAEACRRIGMDAVVLPNGLDPAGAPPAPRTTGSEIWLGYASGSPTHQRDFAVIAPVLASLLARHSHARLRVVGELVLREFPELDAVAAQVEQRPTVPPEAVAAELARLDVALAPLEIGNPFCEAKSPLKWVEAAAVGVPVVASATRSFAEAVRQGETGFLARTTGDWEQALERLIGDDALRARIGAAARAAAERDYGAARLGARARDAYAGLVAARRGSADQLAVTLAIEPVVAGGTVPHRLLTLADALAARGHEVRVVVCGGSAASDESFLALREEGTLARLRFAGAIDDLACSDVLLAATPATVAAIAAQPRRAARRGAIGVTDTPPDVLALPWEPPATRADGLPLFLDQRRWSGDPSRDGRDWLVCVLSGRAEGPMATLALDAMARLAPSQGVRTLVLVGAPHDAWPARLSVPHLDLGWQPERELALVFRRAAAGLVLRDPFDTTTGLAMLASGCPVVALDGLDARALYAGAESVMLVPPDAAAVASGVVALLRDAPDAATARAAAAQRWAQALPGPDEAAAALEARLHAALAD